MLPPPLPHQVQILEHILDRIGSEARSSGAAPVVVFDLDGTLLDVRPRTLQILLEYADEVRNESGEVSNALTTLDTNRVHHLLSDTLRECGLHQLGLVRELTHYWQERFYTDAYCQYDVPVAGAPEFLRACLEAGARVVYMGGRDTVGMLLGTVSTLREHGFPVADVGVGLVLKPDATLTDEAFHRRALPALARKGRIIAVFDDEPANASLARGMLPDADIALVESRKLPDIDEGALQVQLITDFRLAS